MADFDLVLQGTVVLPERILEQGYVAVRDGKSEFIPIKMGIAGDKYFEVLSGLKAGDQVITANAGAS